MRRNLHTAKALLLDRLLADAGHGGLEAYVAYHREAGVSWAALARLIEKNTGHVVNDRSLRNWLQETAEVAA